MAKKNALGRGLGALIDDADSSSQVESRARPVELTNEIDLDKIEINPFQPRQNFDEDSLVELASSIKEIGVIQPITVRRINDDNYQIITGERRVRAARIAGLSRIPAFIRTTNDQGMLEMALVENIQREDLDSIEVAISYQRLIDECQLTQENLSLRVGKKRSTITNYLRLLKLPAEIQLGIREKKITMGHARTLVNVEDPRTQIKIFDRILNEDLSVRKVEEITRKINTTEEIEEKTSKQDSVEIPQEYEDLKKHLNHFFNTKVEFRRNNKGTGKIVINFNSDEDLERIIGIFDKLNH